jgi:hypothetical protein
LGGLPGLAVGEELDRGSGEALGFKGGEGEAEDGLGGADAIDGLEDAAGAEAGGEGEG